MPEQGNAPVNPNAFLHQLIKACFLVLSPVGCWAVIRLVFWIISSPHIFLFFWFLGLGIGKAAEYFIDAQNEDGTTSRPDQRERRTSRSRNRTGHRSRSTRNTVLAVSNTPTRVTFKAVDSDSENANMNPKHEEFESTIDFVSVRSTCQNFELSPRSTKLLESEAPGVTGGWDSKIPKIRKQRCLATLNKEGQGGKKGITKDFLDQNANSYPETEWGTMKTG